MMLYSDMRWGPNNTVMSRVWKFAWDGVWVMMGIVLYPPATRLIYLTQKETAEEPSLYGHMPSKEGAPSATERMALVRGVFETVIKG